jgi:hypothetical protein
MPGIADHNTRKGTVMNYYGAASGVAEKSIDAIQAMADAEEVHIQVQGSTAADITRLNP